MAETFTYRVRDRSGRLLQGVLEARDPDVVAVRLRSMGYTPVSIERRQIGGLQREIKLPGTGRVRLRDIAVFSRQFATMIHSGLTLLRSLHVLKEQTENPALAVVIDEVRTDVERGASLSQALRRHPKAFGRLYVAMVHAGETGGVLDTVLLRLAATIEKQVELRRRVVSALTYPAAVFGLVIAIVVAMLLLVVPMFEDLYDQLGGTLPIPTAMLLAASGAVRRFFPLMLIGGVGGWFGIRRWSRSDAGRARLDALKLRVPVFGKLVHKTALTRFASTLAVLLRSGVPVLESLEITAATVDNYVLTTATRDVQEAVKRGESMATRLRSHSTFPPMLVQMLAVGEETGTMDTMLERVADFYDQEVEATVNALTSLLEPLLIVVMGATVGGMVVALYMPMFNIVELIQ